MKILFQTDPHIKEIGPHANESRFGPKYSTRLDLTIESFKWFYELARTSEVDLIIHGGDIIDKPLILAKEGHAIREAFSLNTTNIPEYVLVGNHERKDKHSHALAILDNYPNVTIIDKPLKLDTFSFLPYDTEIEETVLATLSNKILFSHVDILGTQFAEAIFSTRGLDPEVLKKYFEVVYNGHIHNPSKNGIVYNLGAFMGSGFGDSYEKYYPSAFIIDTETLQVITIENPYAIHYETIVSKNIVDIKQKLDHLVSRKFNFYLRIQCPNEIKKAVRELADSYLAKHKNILSVIVIGMVRAVKSTELAEQVKGIQKATSPVEAILGFAKITTPDKLPATLEEVLKFIVTEYTLGDV